MAEVGSSANLVLSARGKKRGDEPWKWRCIHEEVVKMISDRGDELWKWRCMHEEVVKMISDRPKCPQDDILVGPKSGSVEKVLVFKTFFEETRVF